jgi:hypothetical protein
VALNESVGSTHDAIARGTLKFDETGTHFGYVAKDGESWRAVVDGTPGPAHDAIGEIGPVFDGQGQHVAYAFSQGGTWKVMRDGVPGRKQDAIADIRFASDGTHLAYVGATGRTWYVVEDTTAGQGCLGVKPGSLILSPNGERYACIGSATKRTVRHA